jgi:plasmid stability protein
MSKMIQVRNVPDSVHKTLKARAAQAGFTLSDYLLRELRKIAEVPTTRELAERVRERAGAFAGVKESGADAVRASRRRS